jgi:hypothetical protein
MPRPADARGRRRLVWSIDCDYDVLFRLTTAMQEDKLLFTLVQSNGLMRWCDIAKHLPGRSGKQCSERYSAFQLKTALICTQYFDFLSGTTTI